MDQANQGFTNETNAFHGTKEKYVSSISTLNFDISMSGKHGARFGKGK